MLSQPTLDIIIVNYNSTGFLLESLDSVYRNLDGLQVQIQVIDNASEDGVQQIEDRFPDVDLTVNSCNRGFAAAVNQGLCKRNAPYVLILNPDTVVRPGFFKTVFSYMETHRDVGVLGPRILNPDGSLQGSARAFPDLITPLFARTSPLTRFFPNNRISRRNILTLNSDGETPMRVDWVAGACMLVRSEAIELIGLMDERFFMYWEDADWCRRMRDHGWQVVYYPAAMVFHHVGASSSSCVFKSVFRFHQSTERLFKKYAQPGLKLIYPFALAGLMLRLGIVLVRQLIHRSVASSIYGSEKFRLSPRHVAADLSSNINVVPHGFPVKISNEVEKKRTDSSGYNPKVVFLNQRRRERPLRENDAIARDEEVFEGVSCS